MQEPRDRTGRPAGTARERQRGFCFRVLVAALLGVGWYGALLIPEFTRRELVGDNGRAPVRMLATMMIASALCSLPAWRLLTGGRSARVAVLGPIVPVLGAIAYTTLVFLTEALTLWWPQALADPSGNPDGVVAGFIGLVAGTIYMFLIGVPVMAGIALVSSFHVAFPMGLLHVAVLRWAAQARAPGSSGGATMSIAPRSA